MRLLAAPELRSGSALKYSAAKGAHSSMLYTHTEQLG
jgi:hypothetical protein